MKRIAVTRHIYWKTVYFIDMVSARALMILVLSCVLAACGASNTSRVFRDEYVTLIYRAPDNEQPSNVFLSGSFNGWHISDPAFKCVWDPLEEGYSIRFTLGAGRYEYRFVADGRWIDHTARDGAPDPLGGRLGVFYVAPADTR